MINHILQKIIGNNDYPYDLTKTDRDWLTQNRHEFIEGRYDILYRVQDSPVIPPIDILSCTKISSERELDRLAKSLGYPVTHILKITPLSDGDHHVLVDIHQLSTRTDVLAHFQTLPRYLEALTSEREVIVHRNRVKVEWLKAL